MHIFHVTNKHLVDQMKTGFEAIDMIEAIDAPHAIPTGGVEVHAKKWLLVSYTVRGDE